MSFIIYFKSSLHKIALLTMMILSAATASFCQDNLTALTNSFNQYHQYASIEKLFVHTDKNFYLAGEILWFKIYVTDITYNKPIDISKVTYAEILDSANKPVLQAKIGMHKGIGTGSLYLPPTLNSGNYKLRAYTNWMKNAGAECFFEKIITIVNAQKIVERPEKKKTTAYNVQFFPEGGNLVADLESKVAFKVTDNDGSGVQAAGYIIDNADTTTHFATSHAGMGNFQFKPISNHAYKAVIQVRGGGTIIKELPAAYSGGLVMHVSDNGDKLTVQVQSNNTNSEAVYLLVHTGAAIKVAQQNALQNGSAAFNFSKSLLGDGIAHIVIFNANRQPLCERLYFKKRATDLNLTLLASQNSFEKRNKVNITLSSPNLKANDTTSLSMAVYRLDSIQSIDDNTITTSLLLTSELKGAVEDVQYYFSGNNKQIDSDLDNLLLINGWSRYKWENILKGKPLFTYIPEYNGHIVTGRVTNSTTGMPQAEIETYLSIPGFRTQFTTATSDSNGAVKFEMKDCYGSTELIAQTKELGNKYKIQIDNPFSTIYSTNQVPVFYLPEQYPNTLSDQSISMQVQNIYAGNKLAQFYLPSIDTTAFYIKPDSKYNLEDYTRFTTMEEVLREYVALVNLTKRNGTYHIQVFDKGHDTPFDTDPLVLLDGVPVLNFNKLLTVDPLKLKSLEVVQKRYYLGTSSFEGILNWKSYAGDLANYELDPSAVVMDYEGLQAEREFYSPVYNENKSSHVPDFRNVLYWNPNITLTNNGTQVLSFYTSDLPGTYAVVIQGISSTGLCGSAVNTFEVKE